MRVMFIVTISALNRKMNTGIENLAWSLSRRGLKVDIISGGHAPDNTNLIPPVGVTYYFTGKSGENPLNFHETFFELITQHDYNFIIGWIPNILTIANIRASQKKEKYVAHQGQIAPKIIIKRLLGKLVQRKISLRSFFIQLWALRKLKSNLSFLISNSVAVEYSTLRSYGLSNVTSKVILRGINLGIFQMVPRASDEITSEHYTVIFTGNMQRSKGVWDVVETVPGLRKVEKLIFCGKQQKITFQEIRRELSNRNFSGIVETYENLSHSKLVKELARAQIFLFPSYSEGLSKSVMEAMACGCCVIAYDIPSNRELIQNGITGYLVEAFDKKALRQQLERVMKDCSAVHKIGRSAAQYASENFSHDNEVNEWVSFLSRNK